MSADPRLAKFLAEENSEIFQAIVSQGQVTSPDDSDVAGIHVEARQAFTQMLRVVSPQGHGKLLILRGKAGSGKTHLLRALRAQVHREHRGYVGYMQMSASPQDYCDYVLGKLLDSMEFQHAPPTPGDSLEHLARKLAQIAGCATLDFTLAHTAQQAATQLVRKFPRLNLDLAACLFSRLRDDPLTTWQVMNYLRGEQASFMNQNASLNADKKGVALDRLSQLARMMWVAHEAPLVLFVDQLEEFFSGAPRQQQLSSAMFALSTIATQIPTVCIVVACLEDAYAFFPQWLPSSILDRFKEYRPALELSDRLTASQIEETVGVRLRTLFGAHFDPLQPTYPFDVEQLRTFAGLSMRKVLQACRAAQHQSIQHGGPPSLDTPSVTAIVSETGPSETEPLEAELTEAESVASPTSWEERWNEFPKPMVEGPRALEVFRQAILRIRHEAPRLSCEASTEADGLRIVAAGDRQLYACICNSNAQGGGLARQLEALEKHAASRGMTPVSLRVGAYPGGKTTKVAKQMADFEAVAEGLLLQVHDADWRTMQAYEAFCREHSEEEGFGRWAQNALPMLSLAFMQSISGSPPSRVEAAAASARAPVPEGLPAPSRAGRQAAAQPRAEALAAITPAAPAAERRTISLGTTPQGFVELLPEELTRHSALLGGSGSGKTTLALNMLEQLLQQGIPVIMLDRKGDLCGYGRKQAAETKLAKLQKTMDVRIYTPGSGSEGRALAMSLLPPHLAKLSAEERSACCDGAAAALASMMKISETKPQGALLKECIRFLSANGEVTLERLCAFTGEPDEAFLEQHEGLGGGKTFKSLTQSLHVLRTHHGPLFALGQDLLDIEALFSPGEGGKTRLTVISTKFLGDDARLFFWVSQFLTQVLRYISASPRAHLQGVLFVDEADIYLPATSKPSTKPPMENLLKRARSGGLGVMLATQSPGDLDYKCKDNIANWFVGRVKEITALDKIRPMFANSEDLAKVSRQKAGAFFWLHDGRSPRMQSQQGAMVPEQLAEDEILAVAKASV